MLTLFLFELNEYFTMTTSTTLVVDEFRDEVLRANFNLTVHDVPCEFLSVDVADMTGTNRHNISKDILKWRLDKDQRHLSGSMAVAAVEHKEIVQRADEATKSADLRLNC